jgi:hypothetical protein
MEHSGEEPCTDCKFTCGGATRSPGVVTNFIKTT